MRTRSESSSEADSFSSGEGSVSSESELGTELHNPVANLDTGGEIFALKGENQSKLGWSNMYKKDKCLKYDVCFFTSHSNISITLIFV